MILRNKFLTVLLSVLVSLCLYSDFIIRKDLERGLTLYEFTGLNKRVERKKIFILKINPKLFSLNLLSASEKNHKPMSMDSWCKKYNLIAGINASMFLNIFKSTGYMKNYDYYNNSRINRMFGAFIVFNPKNRINKTVNIISKEDRNWLKKIKLYNTVIQNYRIIDNGKIITWKKDRGKPIAAIGIDNSGNVHFVISPNKITVNEFAEIIKSLPLDIRSLVYLEGGFESVLCLRHKKLQLRIQKKPFGIGYLNDFIGLPNIIGIGKKD